MQPSVTREVQTQLAAVTRTGNITVDTSAVHAPGQIEFQVPL